MSQTIQWQSEEAVNTVVDGVMKGVYLTAFFTFPSTPSDPQMIAADFSCTGAPDDVCNLLIPLDRSYVATVQFIFQNKMELQGKCWAVYFTKGDSPAIGISSSLSFGREQQPGSMIFCRGVLAGLQLSSCPPLPVFPCPPPLPPSPECPDAVVGPGIQEVANAFPYIFLRKWSGSCTENCCTVLYSPMSSPPQNTLYECLLQASPHTWAVLQNTVDLYLTGALQTDFPYLCSITRLQGPIAGFHRVYCDLRLRWPCEDPRLQILSLLEISEEQLIWYLGSPEYAGSKQRCWQNYFALVIKMGCLMQLLEQLAETLLGAFVIEWLFLFQQGVPCAPADFKRRLDAGIILPAELFPLPSPLLSPPNSPPGCNAGTAQIFSIGEMQLLQLTPVRYQPGDLARIVNILAREKRERSRRWREEGRRVEEEKSVSSTGRSSATNAEISQLFRQALESAASQNLNADYDNFKVTYGSPASATLSGGWSEKLLPGAAPSDRNLQRLGYELADRSRMEVSRHVERLRIEHTFCETEENDTSVIDNTASDENRAYVYRWLDRIYSAQVYQSGLRLVVRFSIPNPARDFRWDAQRYGNHPTPLREFGISSFEQINLFNYACLLARYNITRDIPPPADKTVPAIIRLNEQKEISLPEGYQAASAYITPAAAANSLSLANVNGAIGRATFSFPPMQSVAITLAGEEQALPVALMGPGISGSPPEPFPANQFAATVEIECHASTALMCEWKARVYDALVRACDEQMGRYRKENGLATCNGPRENPARLKAIQRQELRRRCVCVLKKMKAPRSGRANRTPPKLCS